MTVKKSIDWTFHITINKHQFRIDFGHFVFDIGELSAFQFLSNTWKYMLFIKTKMFQNNFYFGKK